MPENRLYRVILPKKGRLKEDFDKAMDLTELGVVKENSRLDYGMLTDSQKPYYLDSRIEVLMQRPADAIDTILRGKAEIAVIGLDTLAEFNAAAANKGEAPLPVSVLQRLPGVSACRLCIAAPRALVLTDAADLSGLRIATSYPETLKAWLKDNNVEGVTVIERDGGLEDTIRLDIADAVCDMVQTGESLRINGLEEKFEIGESAAALITRADQRVCAVTSLFFNRLHKAALAMSGYTDRYLSPEKRRKPSAVPA